ncbi:hypothetical protein [Streptomyces sp. NRRL S-350]|uniref:hypothetical protein n=1 Tax=Streptomyces sp. NRRL S-350 TaxID=1463902 RepID=UPI0004BE8CEF|nr:hypothetical protein [Streptomyces sp. NRRL S-350]
MILNLATCTYQEYRPPMGLAVRTTVGGARFFTEPVAGHAQSITPSRDLVDAARNGLPADAYELQYRRMLNATGIDAIRAELEFIARRSGAGDTPLVLLCFDVLSKPGNWCHRNQFSRWYEEVTGEVIPELGAQPRQAPAAPPTLFDL